MSQILLIPARRWPTPALWLDASDASTYTLADTNRVTSWRNKQNAAHEFTAAADARPTYSATSFGGRAGITFDLANSQHLRGAYTPSLTALTVAVVLNRPSSATSMDLVTQWDSGANQRSWSLNTNGQSLRAYMCKGGTTASGFKSYTASSTIGTASTTLGFIFSAGTLTLWNKGAIDTNPTKTTDTAVETLHASTADMVIGASLNSGSVAGPYSGQLREVCIWHRALSATQLLAWHNSRGL